MITALGGGVGAGKFIDGLSRLIPPGSLNIVVNTADDINLYGLDISPDVDTIIYWLSGLVDKKKGWGIKNDTFKILKLLNNFGVDTWFKIGDKDFLTHIYRTTKLKEGKTLTDITFGLSNHYKIDGIKIYPMTNQKVETWIETNKGKIHFQEYFVKNKMKPRVKTVNLKGIRSAKPSPGIISAIRSSKLIILCPSNPIISIGPILSVQGIREEIRRSVAKVVAISPLIGGKPLKGPADKLMKAKNMAASSSQIARLYSDFLDLMVVDHSDLEEEQKIRKYNIETLVTNIIISDTKSSKVLSKQILKTIGYL